MYHYKIKTTGYGSNKYGKCEVCSKLVTETFIQKKFKEYLPNRFSQQSMTFGHYDCLISIRNLSNN